MKKCFEFTDILVCMRNSTVLVLVYLQYNCTAVLNLEYVYITSRYDEFSLMFIKGTTKQCEETVWL